MVRNFFLCESNKADVIDINKTVLMLKRACEKLIKITSSKSKKVMFVCTKGIAKAYIKKVAEEVGMPYIVERWFGGILTNFSEVKRSIRAVYNVKSSIEGGRFSLMSKKDIGVIKRKNEKDVKVLEGVADRNLRMPSALIVIDANKDCVAISEANDLNIPVFALVDSNVNPKLISDPIPANDDSLSSIKFIVERLKEAIIEGRARSNDLEISIGENENKGEGERVVNK